MSDRLFIISLTQPYKVIILFYDCRCVSIMLYECSRPLTGADVTHLQFLMNLIEKIMESVGSACVAAGRPSATLSRCVLVSNSPNGKGTPRFRRCRRPTCQRENPAMAGRKRKETKLKCETCKICIICIYALCFDAHKRARK